MLAYCRYRAEGLKSGDSARSAGYLPSSAAITAARLEVRADVQGEIARIKKLLKAGKSLPVISGPDPAEFASPLEPWKLKDKYTSALELIIDVMNNPKAPAGLRLQCAKDALPFTNARKAESGKKEKAQEDAEKIAGGRKARFSTQATPLRRAA